MAELAFLIIAIAIAVLVLAIVPTCIKVARITEEVRESIAVFRVDLDITLRQTNTLIEKTNDLVDDVNEKLETVNPFFEAVADLSETVTDLNQQARGLGHKASALASTSGKAVSIFSVGRMANRLFSKSKTKVKE